LQSIALLLKDLKTVAKIVPEMREKRTSMNLPGFNVLAFAVVEQLQATEVT
jgi:hypothetical protein